jgi:hypothetical protein
MASHADQQPPGNDPSAMDVGALITAIVAHGTTVGNMLAMKRVNTGDRALDSAMGMLLSVLLAFVMAQLHRLRDPAKLWKTLAAAVAPCRRAPAAADEKQADDGPYDGCAFPWAKAPPLDAAPPPRDDRSDGSERSRAQPVDAPYFTTRISESTSVIEVAGWYLKVARRQGAGAGGMAHGRSVADVALAGDDGKPPPVTAESKADSPEAQANGEDGASGLQVVSLHKQPVWRAPDGAWVYLTIERERGSTTTYATFASPSADAVLRLIALIHVSLPPRRAIETDAASRRTAYVPRILRYASDGGISHDGYVNPRRTLSALFFDQRDELERMVEAFKAGTLVPPHVPLDSKLGVLLHGPPGTGKTAVVCAVALALGRDLILVDMRDVTSRADFSQLMRHSRTHVVLFDELDLVLGALKRPEGKDDDDDDDDGMGGFGYSGPFGYPGAYGGGAAFRAVTYGGGKHDDSDAESDDESRRSGSDDGEHDDSDGGDGGDSPKPKKGKKAKKAAKWDPAAWAKKQRAAREKEKRAMANVLDLAYVLTAMDGVACMSGSVVFATTNCPDKLDPALRRPGRLGYDLELTYASRTSLTAMLKFVFGGPAEAAAPSLVSALVDAAAPTLPDGTVTPATVLQMAEAAGITPEGLPQLLARLAAKAAAAEPKPEAAVAAEVAPPAASPGAASLDAKGSDCGSVRSGAAA